MANIEQIIEIFKTKYTQSETDLKRLKMVIIISRSIQK
jgi:hypothetical protein